MIFSIVAPPTCLSALQNVLPPGVLGRLDPTRLLIAFPPERQSAVSTWLAVFFTAANIVPTVTILEKPSEPQEQPSDPAPPA